MNKELCTTILDTIESYQRIAIFRHFRPDGDCVGASKGLQTILRLTHPHKEIVLVNEDYADYLSFLGKEDDPVDDCWLSGALGIVLDSGSADRISSQRYTLCPMLIKIDHHIEREPYGNISWVEEEKSSTCEMIAELYSTFSYRLKIDSNAATALYTGMVTDSGRFRFRGVTGDTMRSAGVLLDQGIDTDNLFADLYLEDFQKLKFKAHIYDIMQLTPNGVAHITLTRELRREFGISIEDAAACISCLEGIKGCLAWLAFIEQDNTTDVRVRLRSRFVAISPIAEKYHGGGHACAAGATLYSPEEKQALLDDADALLAEFKANNTNWK